jgi:hypothetical protein
MESKIRLKPSPDIVCKVLPNQVVILELDSGEYFSLDEAGLLIWNLLDGQRSLGDVVDQVCKVYNVPAPQALADVTELLRELRDNKVLVEA